MKSQTQKKNAPKAKSKAPEPSKKTQAKVVAPVETATASAAPPPPLSSKKVAKAPAAALKNLELAMKESARKACEAAEQKLLKKNAAPRKNVNQVPDPVAPGVVPKKRSAPPTSGKPTVAAPKRASPAQEVPKEEAPSAPKAETNEVPAAKAATATKSVGKSIAVPPNQKPKPKRAKNVLRGKRMSKKKVWQRFVIDCGCVAEDLILDISDLEKYLSTHIKIKNKVNQLKDQVTFERVKNSSLIIHSSVHFSKRYFKYLTKRYLQKHSLRDWVRVVSTGKDTFTMFYFKIQAKDDDDDVEDNAGETFV